jgi:hypothetical protein
VAAEPVPVAPLTPKEVKGEGIIIRLQADGQVSLKTEDLWKAKVDTTYSDCTFYRNAIPTLERQLSPERAALLKQICPN